MTGFRFPAIMPSPPMPLDESVANKLDTYLESDSLEETWRKVHTLILSYSYAQGSQGRRDYYREDSLAYMEAFGISTEMGHLDPEFHTGQQMDDMFGTGYKVGWHIAKHLCGRITALPIEEGDRAYTSVMDRAVTNLLMSLGWE